MKSVHATKIVAIVGMLLVASSALAAWPNPADPNGPNPGAGRAFAQAPAPSPTNPEASTSGVDRALAAFPTIVDSNGPSSGVERTLVASPSPVDPYGGTTSGTGRTLPAPGCDLGGPAGCWPANRA